MFCSINPTNDQKPIEVSKFQINLTNIDYFRCDGYYKRKFENNVLYKMPKDIRKQVHKIMKIIDRYEKLKFNNRSNYYYVSVDYDFVRKENYQRVDHFHLDANLENRSYILCNRFPTEFLLEKHHVFKPAYSISHNTYRPKSNMLILMDKHIHRSQKTSVDCGRFFFRAVAYKT